MNYGKAGPCAVRDIQLILGLCVATISTIISENTTQAIETTKRLDFKKRNTWLIL